MIWGTDFFGKAIGRDMVRGEVHGHTPECAGVQQGSPDKLRRERSSSKPRLRCRVPAALQSTLEFLQEHTCTLRSVMFTMGGFPESVTMMGRL